MSKITRRQKEIIEAMKQGAILWHPYIRASSSFAYLVSEDINEQVKYSTVDKLLNLGIIEEIEDDNSDVNYRVKLSQCQDNVLGEQICLDAKNS